MKRTSRQSLMRFNNILSKNQYISLKWNDWLNWWMNNFLDGSKDLLSLKRVKTTDICDSSVVEDNKDIWEKAIQQFCKISHGLVDKVHDCMHRSGDTHKYWTYYHLCSDKSNCVAKHRLVCLIATCGLVVLGLEYRSFI